MKRFLYGFAAMVVAAASAAFATPKETTSKLQNSIFQFNTLYQPTQANVEDESKWILVSDATGCPTGTARACKIEVSPDYVNGTSLKSEVEIHATETSGVAYVDGGNMDAIYNRTNP